MDRIVQNYRNYGNNIPITKYRVMRAFRVEEVFHGFLIYRLHEGNYLALCPRHKISDLRTYKRMKVDQIPFN
jgi:hypothetical protein